MESFFKTLKVERTICFATTPVRRPGSTSSTGSRVSTIAGACIRRSATRHQLMLNRASWLPKVVYVESRQGQLPWRYALEVVALPTRCVASQTGATSIQRMEVHQRPILPLARHHPLPSSAFLPYDDWSSSLAMTKTAWKLLLSRQAPCCSPYPPSITERRSLSPHSSTRSANSVPCGPPAVSGSATGLPCSTCASERAGPSFFADGILPTMDHR